MVVIQSVGVSRVNASLDPLVRPNYILSQVHVLRVWRSLFSTTSIARIVFFKWRDRLAATDEMKKRRSPRW
jgi:hypothetical protein